MFKLNESYEVDRKILNVIIYYTHQLKSLQ